MSVLCYHKIDDNCADWNNIVTSTERFRRHIEFIVTHYDVKPTSCVARGDRAVSITFDDGYADNLYNALPILEEYGVPATVFVSTLRVGSLEEDWCNELSRLLIEGGVGRTKLHLCGLELSTRSQSERTLANRLVFQAMLDMDVAQRDREMERLRRWSGPEGRVPRRHYRMLNADELRALSRSSLLTIGSHTVNHPSVGRLSIGDQAFELTESKRAIERIIGKTVTQFAYPFGGLSDYTRKTISILRDVGYERAFSTTKKCYQGGSLYEISRKCVSNIGIDVLKTLIESQWDE